jgi:hypothetical protein
MKLRLLIVLLLLFGSSICLLGNPNHLSNRLLNPNEQQMEKNLRYQLTEYLLAVNEGNADAALKYIYPDVFVYMKKQYPEDFNIDRIKKQMRESLGKMKASVKQQKLTYSIKIGEITNRVTSGTYTIYTIVVRITSKKGLDEASFGEEVISITGNRGVDWTFVSTSDITAPILNIKFSQETVSKILRKHR